ncbi:MAG: hypothetical protein WCJ03_11450 [Bacteroidales bacterium]
MAIVKGPIVMTGGFGNASFYTRRGSDKVIARTKGGASKEKIKSSPKFEGLRLQQKEWKGCTAFASVLRYAFGGLHRLADYNLTPVLNGFAKNLQKTDVVNPVGKRSVCLSALRYTLENFNFNRTYPFTSVLRVMVQSAINRETGSATVNVPRINTETDVLNVQRLPYFRLIVVLGVVADLVYDEAASEFRALVPDVNGISEVFTGNWLPAENLLEEQTISVQLDDYSLQHLTDDCTLVLSMAIEFGKVGFTGAPQEVKYAGSGRVLRVG